jgi:hypothetical protein
MRSVTGQARRIWLSNALVACRRRRCRGRTVVGAVAAALLVALAFGPGATRISAAHADASGALTAGDTVQPEIGLPAGQVMLFGASEVAAQGEVWATGHVGDVPLSLSGGQATSDGWVLLEHTDANGWQGVPVTGGPDNGQLPAKAESGAQSGRAMPDGGAALWTTSPAQVSSLVTVNPGGATGQIAPLPQPGGGVLDAGETLLPSSTGAQTIPFAAIDQGGGTGVLVAPQNDGSGTLPPGVLLYDPSGGGNWQREPVEDVPAGATFSPDALACGPGNGSVGDSPTNCWMLATVTVNGQPTLTLYGRVSDPNSSTGEGWAQETVSGEQLLSGTDPQASVSALTGSSGTTSGGAQMLTVTSQGIWVDFQANIAGNPVDASEFLEAGAPGQLSSAGTWCSQVIAPDCPSSLGGSFPSTAGYLSYAWTGSGIGERIITGGPQGTLLEFSGSGDFSQQVGTGGDLNAGDDIQGGAFDSPTEGWVSDGTSVGQAVDGEGEPQVEEFTNQPTADALTSDSVPFGSPLLAVAAAPGTTPGDPSAAAMAVGVSGEVAQYVPGSGWTPQALLNSAGETQTPTLRGVAWPEVDRAYAVGDNGAMWIWQGDTGLWEPDPAKPFNFDENLTGIAFAPNDPDLGWAVGKDGTMLQFGKTWTQAALPASLENVDFTSIAFAGDVALATYRSFEAGGLSHQYFTGGLAINTGSGWVPDTSADAALDSIPSSTDPDPGDAVLSKVAGLPDGGAVAAGPGVVIETDNVTTGTWSTSPQPLPEAANVSALAAYRQTGGQVGAIVSIEVNENLDPNGTSAGSPDGTIPSAWQGEIPASVTAGGPPAFEPPDPFPDTGYLLEQTAQGSWGDMEHMTYPVGEGSGSQSFDVPIRPDPVLALLVNPIGTEGLAVGGQTGDTAGTATAVTSSLAQSETAGIMRFGGGAATSTGVGTARLSADASQANFVLGGDAACAAVCADQAGLSLAPDVSLVDGLSEAGQISGVRGFLYDGGRFVDDQGFSQLGGATLGPELGREAQLFSGAPSSLPVYAAPSNDAADSPVGGLGPFLDALATVDPGQGGVLGTAGEGYYAFTSPATGSSGRVMVIVLDFASDDNTIDATQLGWLQAQLQAAKQAHEPAIVMGADALGFTLPDPTTVGPQEAAPASASAVISTLVQYDASAYLFDYPGANVQTTITAGGDSIPAFGSGTLGYVQPPTALADSLGSSAMLVISVQTAHRNASTNVAPVTATAIPNISELAIDATNGTLLRRSEVALFDGLARRPLEGTDWQANSSGASTFLGPEPYDPIPNDCQGRNCAYQIPEQFSFTSSQPSIGNFVEHDASSSNPLAVALASNELPIADSSSGLFCAFNAGTTTISLTAGDLSYSMPVTVQSGSVEYPCGTVPAYTANLTGTHAGVSIPPITTKVQPKIQPKIHHRLSVPIPRPIIHHAPQPAPHHQPAARPAPTPARPHPLPTVPNGASAVPPVRGIAPAAPAPAARPVPPSGTSQVPSNSSVAENIPVAQREREKLAATQGVDAMAVHDPDGPLPLPTWTIALLVLAAATGGLGLRRRGGGDTRFAWVGRVPQAGSGARARTWRRPPPGGGRR